MIHLLRGSATDPHHQWLIVAPERSIEQQRVSLRQSLEERRRQLATTRNESTRPTGCLFVHEQPDSVALAGFACKLWRSGWDDKRFDRETARTAVGLAERHVRLERELCDLDVRKRACEGENFRVQIQNRSNRCCRE